MHSFPQKCGCIVKAWNLRENWPSLSQHLTIANSCTARGRILGSTHLSMLGLCLVWVCIIFLHAVATNVNSYVQPPWCVPKILLPSSHGLLLVLALFLHPNSSSNNLWAEKLGGIVNVQFRAENCAGSRSDNYSYYIIMHLLPWKQLWLIIL